MDQIFFNLSKRKQRDLLPELLSGKTTDGIISKKELIAVNSIIEFCFSSGAAIAIDSPVKKYVTKTPVTRGKKTNTKKKTTLIRTLGKRKIQSSLSKSQIVNHGLSLSLAKFAQQGEKAG
jgi:hypothetical protein